MENRDFVHDIYNAKAFMETKTLVELFLNENLNYLEIYEKTHIPFDRIKARLTNVFILKKLYGIKSQEIYTAIINKMQQLSNEKRPEPKLKVELFYKRLEDQRQFLIHLALTFRATFKTIEELFNISLDNLFAQTDEYTYSVAFNYLNVELLDQEEVKRKIIAYYKEYLDAYRNKDIEKIRKLIRSVTDYDIKKYKLTHVVGSPFTSDDIIALLKYQLKYGLSNNKMGEIFHIDSTKYSKNVYMILEQEQYKDLKIRYERLMDYNISLGTRHYRNG